VLVRLGASLGFVHYHYDWDWAAAEKEFTRAISLNPQSTQSYTLYTDFLAGMGIARDTLFQNFVYEQSLKRSRA
jgi:hypothetical protein